ncbi:hypothetical protein [Actinosynnema sp. NPDC023587]|uniref:tetratricopeptide repeat protein n=1 Tax=Actinosynnema sp. NPDC023587 TaxID=3154695 RepID=UPI0033CDB431
MLAAVGLSSAWWLPSLLQLLDSYWSLSWEERDQRASVFGMVIGGISAVLSVASIWQSRRSYADVNAAAEVLPVAAGRVGVLPRMKVLSAGRARVHEALPLPVDYGRARRRHWVPWQAAGDLLDSDLPLFVDRNASQEVAKWMRPARRKGGFLLLVGTSSVGKTRLLYDIARRELGDFLVLVPDLGDGAAVNALAEAGPPGPVVVWLDELQRFLSGPYFVPDGTVGQVPVSAGALRRLLDGDTPVIVLATLWPNYLDQLRATDTDDKGATKSRYPAAADVLALRTKQLRVDTFSEEEKRLARELGIRDPRLAAAADGVDFNVTETLAGAPRIMQRYREAPLTRQAVVHAAVDARRLGIQGPLSRELLREASRGYLVDVHPDDTWFGDAVAELTRTDRREDAATAPLQTIPTADHRGIIGYTVTDYLLQQLLCERRSELLDSITWNAFIDYVHEADDRHRLATHAWQRLQYHHAERLYRTLADRAADAAVRLANLLTEQGRTDEAVTTLRPHADAGDSEAAEGLAELLLDRDEFQELFTRADAGDIEAAVLLADTLVHSPWAGPDTVDDAVALLSPYADKDLYAALVTAELLVDHDRDDEAATLLRPYADDGEAEAAAELAEILLRQDRMEELYTRADAGDVEAAAALAKRLADEGMVDEGLALLRPHADAGEDSAVFELGKLLAKQGRIKELRARADAGDSCAAYELAHLLAMQEREEELRARIDAGDSYAAVMLDALLVKQGKADEAIALLRARVAAGDSQAVVRLSDLLVRQGRVDQAIAVLRDHVNAGDSSVASGLARLLAEQDEQQLLWREVHAGNRFAFHPLIELIRKAGRSQEADQLLVWGVSSDGSPARPW